MSSRIVLFVLQFLISALVRFGYNLYHNHKKHRNSTDTDDSNHKHNPKHNSILNTSDNIFSQQCSSISNPQSIDDSSRQTACPSTTENDDDAVIGDNSLKDNNSTKNNINNSHNTNPFSVPCYYPNSVNRVWLEIMSDISPATEYFSDLMLCYRLRKVNEKNSKTTFLGKKLKEEKGKASLESINIHIKDETGRNKSNKSDGRDSDNNNRFDNTTSNNSNGIDNPQSYTPRNNQHISNTTDLETEPITTSKVCKQPKGWAVWFLLDMMSLTFVFAFSVGYRPLLSLVLGTFTEKRFVSKQMYIDNTGTDFVSKYSGAVWYNSSSLDANMNNTLFECVAEKPCWELGFDYGLQFNINRVLPSSDHNNGFAKYMNHSISLPLDSSVGYVTQEAYATGFGSPRLFDFELTQQYNYAAYEGLAQTAVKSQDAKLRYHASAAAIPETGFGASVSTLLLSNLCSSFIHWKMNDVGIVKENVTGIAEELVNMFDSLEAVKYYSIGQWDGTSNMHANKSTNEVSGCSQTLDGLGVCMKSDGFNQLVIPTLLSTVDGLIVLYNLSQSQHRASLSFTTSHITHKDKAWFSRTSSHTIALGDSSYNYPVNVSSTIDVSLLDVIYFGEYEISFLFGKVQELFDSHKLATRLLAWNFVTEYQVQLHIGVASACTATIVSYSLITCLFKITKVKSFSTAWSLYRECALPNCAQTEGVQLVDKVGITFDEKTNEFHYGISKGSSVSFKDFTASQKLIA